MTKPLSIIILCFSMSALAYPVANANHIVLFSHGIADTYKQAFAYAPVHHVDGIAYRNVRSLFACPWATFNYPDATESFLRVNYHETSFGQENEIARLFSAYKKTVKYAYEQWDDCNIILFGLSRGASNIAILAGIHQLPQVKALILESPFYTMHDVIAHIMDRCTLSWLAYCYGQSVAEFIFKKYTRYGKSPATTIENIPKDLPILIICSKEDHLVPWSSSVQLYKKLRESGHDHAHILILDHGRHSKILSDQDGQKYHEVVHAFYKKYNLPHAPSIAARGELLCAECQPLF